MSWWHDHWFEFVLTFVAIHVAFLGIQGAAAYLILLERKLSAWMQDRIGPNRVGYAGLFQPLADGAKFLLKEDVIPGQANKFLYVFAPCISILTTFLAFSVVPFGPVNNAVNKFHWIIAPGVDLGLVFIFAISSLAVYAVILGGWASNNKYSLLGSLRASAQVISYEIPLGMSVVGIAVLMGTMNLEKILFDQAQNAALIRAEGWNGICGIFGWNIWYQPLAALIFFTAALAESNRLPFDLAECESELVGGFHTEYSAMKFAMFFLGEYCHVITVSFLTIILFFGGWHFPWIAEASSLPAADASFIGSLIGALPYVAVLLAKVGVVLVLIQMIRWTIPRFRFDQLMGLAWKGLIPMATVNVLMVMVVRQFEINWFWLFPISMAIFAAAGLVYTQGERKPAVAALAPAHGHH